MVPHHSGQRNLPARFLEEYSPLKLYPGKSNTMAKRFSNLIAKMPKWARERARARTRAMAADLTLAELRKAFDVSQEELAKFSTSSRRTSRRSSAEKTCGSVRLLPMYAQWVAT